MVLKYTLSGYIYISASDDCNSTVDAMLATNYNEEFCIAENFNPEFIARLMEAGFLMMSMNLSKENPFYIALPKLHLVRSALFFENLHVKKSIKRLLNMKNSPYQLCFNTDFDHILDRCVEKHGADWLSPPLVDSIKKIRLSANSCILPQLGVSGLQLPVSKAYPTSFALYRDGKLVAGEFGVIYGKVYTSYSGFYDEDNTGTLQIILTTRYLQENGYSFFDMGMPLDYKTDLGAVDISPEEFVKLFRE